MRKTLYIVRHGQTDMNAANVWQGCQIDVPLNAVGEKQAEDLAEKVLYKGITHLYCSPLIRAVQTANKIAQKSDLGLPITILQDLREINFGDAEGLTFDESHKQYGTLFDEILFPTKATWNKHYLNGESKHEAFDRFMRCLELIVAGSNYTVGVVCHGGLISALCCGLGLVNVRIENCAVLCLQYDMKSRLFIQV